MDMEHLDTFSPSSQEHQEALYLGVKSKSASRRKGPTERRKKALFTLRLNITFGRIVEAEVLLRVESRQVTRPQYGVNFKAMSSAKSVGFHWSGL